MKSLSLRSFCTEFLKLAFEIQDPDIRALKADRKGKEYLQGGRLPSNAVGETNFSPKLASKSIRQMLAPRELTPQETKYDKVKDYGLAAAKGTVTGVGINSLGHSLAGMETLKPSTKSIRAASLIGLGVGVGDRMFERRKKRQMTPQPMVKKALLQSQNFTPARALQAGTEVGKFENVIHKDAPIRPFHLGNTGTLPK